MSEAVEASIDLALHLVYRVWGCVSQLLFDIAVTVFFLVQPAARSAAPTPLSQGKLGGDELVDYQPVLPGAATAVGIRCLDRELKCTLFCGCSR